MASEVVAAPRPRWVYAGGALAAAAALAIAILATGEESPTPVARARGRDRAGTRARAGATATRARRTDEDPRRSRCTTASSRSTRRGTVDVVDRGATVAVVSGRAQQSSYRGVVVAVRVFCGLRSRSPIAASGS